MEVTNVSCDLGNNRNNSPLLPKNLRSLIVGKSNCGKTVLLLNLLLKKDWLDYNNLLFFGNSLHQKEYRILKKGFEKKLSKLQILYLFQNKGTLAHIEAYDGPVYGNINAEFYENCANIPDPKSLDPSLKNLLILDDCYLGRQSKAAMYYTRGRHNNCDTIYISQNYFALPRASIRENSNFIVLFQQNAKSVEHIHRDHCTDLPYEEFKKLCEDTWSVKHNFAVIDLTSSPHAGKYRRNLNCFYIPQKYHSPSER